ncbi:MAG TPA: site-2 protease family protein [Thermoleophilia bacterium]|nr:site-2 protease family protein [Thermoleophilia bacterium]
MQGLSADLLLILPVLLVSLVLHELAHGLVADALGDPTPRAMGRLTLNPLPHLDLFGTVMLVITTLAPGGFLFGWAKPVPVDPRHFRSPQRGMMIVGAAGPLTNFAIAVGAAQLLRFAGDVHGLFFEVFWDLYVLNLFLGFLNLLPIPPLDGSRVIGGLLPARLYPAWVSLDRFGNLLFLVLFVILVSNPTALTNVFYPLFRGVSQVLLPGWV